MEVVLIVGLFCALIYFIHLSDKNDEKLTLHVPSTTPLPPPERFVSVVFKEGQEKLYDYFIGDNYDLQVGDLVEVLVNSPYTGRELKTAIVKYVGRHGERSERAYATVIRKITYIPQPTPIQRPQLPYNPPTSPQNNPPAKEIYNDKRFVQVIFKKHAKKRFDYFLGENYDIRVGDFVVVHVNNSGRATWKIAKVVYISKQGEISNHAKSKIIKKADYPKW